jgi:hypothetical protein
MIASSLSGSDKILVDFAWTGRTRVTGFLDIREVELVIKGARTAISIDLPESINLSSPQKFPFTCRKPAVETHPDSLLVTLDQIHNLTIKAHIFENLRFSKNKRQTDQKYDSDVELEIPDQLEAGQTYVLVVSSGHLSLSARLVKEEIPGFQANNCSSRTKV